MSWSIRIAGPVADVQRAIAAEPNVPAPVKEMLIVAAALAAPATGAANYPPPADSGLACGVLIESSGHVDPAYRGNVTMNVQSIFLALTPD